MSTISSTGTLVALAIVLAGSPVRAAGQGTPSKPAEPAASPASAHGQHQEKPKTPPAKPAEDHSAHRPAADRLPAPIPPLTDEDRRAAFPDVGDHTAHAETLHYFVLFDQLEWQGGGESHGFNVDSTGWIGRDRDRFWFRAEAEREDDRFDEAEAHLLYGRQFSRWWDVVAGIRQDVRPGPAQTWAAVGVQGLAPYWFEVEATAYIGGSGRTQFRLETEYEVLLTNRLVLQPRLELELAGKADPERGLGAGPTSTDLGLRLRYEIKRELAPYLGVTWNWKHGKTADLAEVDGERASGARLVAGVRIWF